MRNIISLDNFHIALEYNLFCSNTACMRFLTVQTKYNCTYQWLWYLWLEAWVFHPVDPSGPGGRLPSSAAGRGSCPVSAVAQPAPPRRRPVSTWVKSDLELVKLYAQKYKNNNIFIAILKNSILVTNIFTKLKTNTRPFICSEHPMISEKGK